jgi:hypothetical protein
MCDFRQLFINFNVNSIKKYKEIFDTLKIYFKTRVDEFLDRLKKSNRGRKRKINRDHFFTCLFFMTDNSMKMYYIKEYFHIAKSIYYYYFDLLSKSRFLEIIYSEIVLQYSQLTPIKYLITDTFTVKSMSGSDGVGRSCTDRGRNGIKVSLICDQNLVAYAVHLEPANKHDSKILIPTIHSSISVLTGKSCLADSGYVGSKYISRIEKDTSQTKENM